MRVFAAVLGVFLAAVSCSPAIAAGRKKKKSYDYESSKYKSYKVLTDWRQFHFDERGNPYTPGKGTKVRRIKRKKRQPEPAGALPAAFGGTGSSSQP